nr:MAG TPA: major capsid protein [Caudoviricetes sp.]
MANKFLQKYSNCDFSGYATRNDLRCLDGRTIRHNAFRDQDGDKVPLVWNHEHRSQNNVLGHAFLENREDGVYAYGYFNHSAAGQQGKEIVVNGDVESLSICANELQQSASGDVLRGRIIELSLCLAGANNGAYIDYVMQHGSEGGDMILANYDERIMIHNVGDDSVNPEEQEGSEMGDNTLTHSGEELENKPAVDNGDEETIADVINTMTEKQKKVVYGLIGAMQAGEKDDDEELEHNANTEGGDVMHHNIFENNGQEQQGATSTILTHSDQGDILGLARSSSVGSLKTAMNMFEEENGLEHGAISGFVQQGTGNVSTLFPEYVEAHGGNKPELITNDMGWVDAIMAKTQKIPKGKVRTSHVDIRNIDSLKAKGYQKGNEKKITGNYQLVRRTTDPQTVYVTSELHRDDIVDLEDFDYVQWQYGIDQINLKETLAIATLFGDEREDSDPEKIFPDHIRPIWTDDELYTIHKDVDFDAMAEELQGTNATSNFGKNFIRAEAMVNTIRMARKEFRGTGKPDLFVSVDAHNTMILARDIAGHRMYPTDTELAAALGVGNIYEVPQMEGKVRIDSNSKKHNLLGIVVNMADYGYGCSKGGDITHFTDFDIKFNQLQSLLETRKSGQLTRIKSALVIEELQPQG